MTTATGDGGAYADAYRLLSQLRSVAGRQPTGLDPVRTADDLLARLRAAVPWDRAVVLGRRDGRLEPLAVDGPAGDWLLDLGRDTALADAWLTQDVVTRSGQHPRRRPPTPAGSCLAVPLLVGVRTVGVVGCESTRPDAYGPAQRAAAVQAARAAALALETALLAAEVRAVATAEERRRLAREIHDGPAQTLAAVGYLLDELAAGAAPDTAGHPGAARARRQLSAALAQLRATVDDLRSVPGGPLGLCGALAEHVRTAAADGGPAVHLSLREDGPELEPRVAWELLRIGQEALTNARRHARAANVWVSCEVAARGARLSVEDDGHGLPDRPAPGRHGLAIMRERAALLPAELRIEPRHPRGTRVVVRVPPPAAALSLVAGTR